MLSKYFEIKTNSNIFEISVIKLIEQLKDKKVIIYGAGQGFFELNKKYDFNKNLNIIAIADKKFEKNNTDITGLKQIKPQDIEKEDYDAIIISNEKPFPIEKFLTETLKISQKYIFKVFKEEFEEETLNLNYLIENKFDVTLPKLIKKLKGKKVWIHGIDNYFELINAYFNLSGLNITGITDFRFEHEKHEDKLLGYNLYKPSEVFDLKPDILLVANKNYMHIIEHIYYTTLKGSKIKIKPLVKKSFLALLKEVCN